MQRSHGLCGQAMHIVHKQFLDIGFIGACYRPKLPDLALEQPQITMVRQIAENLMPFLHANVERRAADRSRQRFQEQIVDRSRLSLLRMQGGTNLQYQNLLSAIVENAQLAALEITDSVEVDRMPELLDSLKSSVERSADLLQHLLRHAESVMKN